MLPRLVLSVPFIGAWLTTAAFVVADVAGVRPWSLPPVTLVQALRDSDALAVRLLTHEGANLLERYALRDGAGREHRLTPIEVATVSDRPEMVDLLQRLGVPVDDRLRAHLVCLAQAAGAAHSVAFLARAGVDAACFEGSQVWHVR